MTDKLKSSDSAALPNIRGGANFKSVVDLDALVRLLATFVHDVECYCSTEPNYTCPVHEAENLLTENDARKS